ncbi:ADP-ribosyltransferase family protein [Streptomyces marianii]|uniref:ADP ribosyltransferase domain-containing protein n=1 Tax=Streptomyces marianii TaxID=1817406 RepID=A0A5R9DTZ1_9ACTN|nr:ADP-ribosyltransferase [Streptomyces marianii]TLQ39224.1 hypothetical protein FEF34_38140 [Streptomyces marianii]
MCRSQSKGGRRCGSSHPAVRAARRAASAQLRQDVAGAGAGHPALGAYATAQMWEAKTRQAVENGEDEQAKVYAENAKLSAAATRTMLSDRKQAPRYPNAADPRVAWAMPARTPEPPEDEWGAAQMPEFPEHVRAADAFARASGAGGAATFVPRADGGQTVAWRGEDFAGSATVYPADGDEPPHARVVFNRLDQGRYQALADSPWPYRVENGQVIYDRVPADHAEQIIAAARSRQAARPWERHGLGRDPHRAQLDMQRAGALVPESKSWAAGLSPEQNHWVSTYTGSQYQQINAHLYNGRDLDQPAEKMDTPMRVVTENINAAIRSAGVAEVPHRTFRGFTPPLEVRKNNRVAQWARENFPAGSRYHSPSFLSSSHCPNVAAETHFAQTYWSDGGRSGEADHAVVFEMVSRRGAALAHVSQYGNAERERLHESGSNWVSVGVQENVTINGRKCVVVQLVDMREVHRH